MDVNTTTTKAANLGRYRKAGFDMPLLTVQNSSLDDASTVIVPDIAICTVAATDPHQLRHHRTGRVLSAWVTSAPSKIGMLLVQIIAIPIVYRSIGPAQFAGYAAVTAAVSILSFLNLGMGGALVTPLAQAAADKDRYREASLFRSALLPVIALAIAGLAIALPLLSVFPLRTLFGLAATGTSGPALRAAAVLACIGTVVAVPLSVVESVRQAYQELHVNNLLNALSNGILCLGLLLASWLAPTLPAFVAVMVFGPLVVRILNAALLFHRRPYLFAMSGSVSWLQARCLAGDGLSYIGASGIGNMLVYQWPIYFMARARSPLESSTFAVFFQLIFFVLAFGTSFALPLWGAIADAVARADYAWIKMVVRRARVASLAYGICGLVVFGLAANSVLSLWLHRPFYVDGKLCWLGGFYVLLAMLENVHWPLALGLGAMRAASGAMFWRAVAFAASVPLVISHGDARLMVALCTSVIAITAWYFPVLLARTFAAQSEATEVRK
jgi:O-antigen/teichoic acid export membrane protein